MLCTVFRAVPLSRCMTPGLLLMCPWMTLRPLRTIASRPPKLRVTLLSSRLTVRTPRVRNNVLWARLSVRRVRAILATLCATPVKLSNALALF